MKKRILSMLTAIVIMVVAIPSTAFAAVAPTVTDGKACANTSCSGTYLNGFCTVCDGYEEPKSISEGYYQLANAGNLYWFANRINTIEDGVFESAILTADIVVNERVLDDNGDPVANASTLRQWIPITYGDVHNYQGSFDGNGHSISGLYCVVSEEGRGIGLFEAIGDYAKISELSILDSYFEAASSESYAGAIAGACLGGDIYECYNEATVRAYYAGGMVALGSGVYILKCINAGKITTTSFVGATAGGIMGGTQWALLDYSNLISLCANVGKISYEHSSFDFVGSLVGYAAYTSLLKCYYDASKYADATGNLRDKLVGKDLENVKINNVESKTSLEFANGTVCELIGFHWNKYVYSSDTHSTQCRICNSNTATEQYHSVQNCDDGGACSVCGFIITQHVYKDDACVICGTKCDTHTFGQDNKCTVCGSSLIEVDRVELNSGQSFVQGSMLPLSSTVYPSNASFQEIEWYIVEGETETKISEPYLKILSGEDFVLLARIENGSGMGEPYECRYKIEVQAVDATYDISEGYLIISRSGHDELYIKQYQYQGDWWTRELISERIVSEDKAIVITGQTTENFIQVQSGSPKLAFDSMNIISENYYYSPVEVHSGASADITLVGNNVLTAEMYLAGIFVPSGASVTIGGNGTLEVTGGSEGSGAGIGGDADNNDQERMSSGDITINGGKITAASYDSAAAIGSSSSGNAGKIVINGGTVTATNYASAAGIGSYIGDAGTIEINGGYVFATGGADAAGIGCGNGTWNQYGSAADLTITGGTVIAISGGTACGIGKGDSGDNGTTTITGGNVYAIGHEEWGNIGGSVVDAKGNSLYLHTLTLIGLEDDGVNHTVDSIRCGTQYRLKDIVTYNGKLYLYLPDGTVIDSVTVNDVEYVGTLENREGIYCGDHDFENGFCLNCNAYEPATLVDGYYEIASLSHLFWFANQINSGTIAKDANARLTADIDLGGREWTPIASTDLYYNTTSYSDKGYSGIFDGNYHTISNFKITGVVGKKSSYGIIGTLSGTVKNLGVDNMTFEYAEAYDTSDTDARAAAIAGQMLDGSLVENCFVINSSLTPENFIVGGVAACNYAGIINNCFTYNVTIKAHGRCGNLVSDTRGDINANDRSGAVTNCYTDASRLAGTQTGNMISAFKEGLNKAYFADGTVVRYLNGTSENCIWKQGINTPAFNGVDISEVPENAFDQPELIDGVYQISTKSELYWFAKHVNLVDPSVNAILLADIDLAGDKLIPIGGASTPFEGNFDGNGKTIDLGAQTVDYDFFAVFGYTLGVDIEDLTVKGSFSIVAKVGYVAAIIGQASGGSITGCNSYVDIEFASTEAEGSYKIAGIAGGLYAASGEGCAVSRCANYGDITVSGALECVAGITGYSNELNSIVNCANYGNIIATGAGYVAGILGYVNNARFGGLTYCFNRGVIVGSNMTVEGVEIKPADIIGWARDFANGTINNNYFTGTTPYGAVRSDKTVESVFASYDSILSGEIAYRLQGEQETLVWGQTIGTDDYPILGGEKVLKDENDSYYNDLTILGDVNGDKLVTNADVLAIYRYIYNADIYPININVGDVTGDGLVTNADVLAIFRYIYNPALYPLG